MNVGSSLLGLINRIDHQGLLLELPNGMFGRVSPLEISHPLTEIYKKVSEKILPESSFPSLHKFFKLGEYVRCVVLSVDEKKRIKLSMRPTLLNTHINVEHIKKGFVMLACIKSVEDHGYNISFGEELDLVGFLPNNKTNKKFQVGELLSVKIDSYKKESKVVTLSSQSLELDKYQVKFFFFFFS